MCMEHQDGRDDDESWHAIETISSARSSRAESDPGLIDHEADVNDVARVLTPDGSPRGLRLEPDPEPEAEFEPADRELTLRSSARSCLRIWLPDCLCRSRRV